VWQKDIVKRGLFSALPFVLTWLLLGCGNDTPRVTGDGPQLTVAEKKFEFGNIPRSAKVSHTYWLYSTGTDTVKITKVKSGCGCTKAPLKRDILPPGDSTELELIFTAPAVPGFVTKGITVSTNEDSVDYHGLLIEAWVVPWPDSAQALRVWPDKMRFVRGGSKKLRASIENVGESEYRLSVVDQPQQLNVVCPESIAAGESIEMVVNYVGETITEAANKSFTFEAVGADTVRFTLPVWLMPKP
jgi:hypothetical protein